MYNKILNTNTRKIICLLKGRFQSLYQNLGQQYEQHSMCHQISLAPVLDNCFKLGRLLHFFVPIMAIQNLWLVCM